MRFSIYIDYPSLYISTSKINNFKTPKDKEKIEDELCKIILDVENYLIQYYKKKKVQIVEKKAFILPDPQFQISDEKLNNYGIESVRVKCGLKKNENKKMVNGSRDDDYYLKLTALDSVKKNLVDGIVIISNDIDHAETGRQIIQAGKYFWIAVYEGKDTHVSRELKDTADICLPIQELSKKKEKKLINRKREFILKGKRLEFYKDGELKLTFPLNKKYYTLGRRSVRRNIIPNIDFADIDEEKILSREQGELFIIGDKLIFSVSENCTRGTWYCRKIKKPLEQFTVKENVPVILGDVNGFVMYYYSK